MEMIEKISYYFWLVVYFIRKLPTIISYKIYEEYLNLKIILNSLFKR